MFLHFIKRKDFLSLERMVLRTPEHVTNADTIINELKPFLDKDVSGNDPHLLESLFRLYQQVYLYENAFYAILKKKDKRVFAFLDQRQIDFPLNPNLGKLLRIDPALAVKYILQRHGRHKSFRIVDTCVQELRKSSS
jgi:hypothetical protein